MQIMLPEYEDNKMGPGIRTYDHRVQIEKEHNQVESQLDK